MDSPSSVALMLLAGWWLASVFAIVFLALRVRRQELEIDRLAAHIRRLNRDTARAAGPVGPRLVPHDGGWSPPGPVE